jgi:DNA-binding transcriptional MerR regulator
MRRARAARKARGAAVWTPLPLRHTSVSGGSAMAETRLSFKDMCAKFDVTPRTLRYYEYIELLSPERAGRARWYGPREIARMTLILRGRKFGYPLEEIRQWLLIYEKEGTVAQMRAWITMADRQLKELAEQRAQLDEAMQELRRLRDETARDLEARDE